jgi:fumarylacetoacetase
VPVERALEHVFGAVLLNDWSARDIQAFEYVPLGPFLGKSFATSISPWVTTLDELSSTRGVRQDPELLDYLKIENFAYDLPLTVELNGEVVSRTNARHLYWNVAQQIAHLTSNGASLRTGDLLATGTISGPGELERGSLIELTWNEGPFLQDGDEVVLRGEPLGEVRGRVVP